MRGELDHKVGLGERLDLVSGPVQRWLAVGSRRILATSLLLALLTWPLALGAPATGLDYSWMSGLYMAVHDGKHFGSEIVFTYGPLGFLAWPQLWFSWLAVLAYLYSAAIYLAFTATLTWLLSRTVGLLAAALVAFLFLVTLPFHEQLPLLLAVGLSFAALRPDRSPRAVALLAVGGGLLCAIEPLLKLSVGPPTVLVCLLGLTGARADRRQWSAFAAIATGGSLSLWLLSGQDLGSLWDYAVNGAQVASGYNEAMGIDFGPAWQAVFLVAFGLGLVALVSRADFRDSRAVWCASALTAVAAFVTFKYGITRFAEGPVALALSALLGIFLMVPWRRQQVALFVTAAAVLGALALHTYPTAPRLDVVANLKQFTDAAELAIRPGLRQQRIDEARASLQAAFAIDPRIVAALRDKRVAVEPWETAIAWAYDLEWSPAPAFQNYVAYTPRLDRLNAAALEDPSGPETILRQIPGGTAPLGGRPGFEGRQPAWDPPQQNLAAVCNFVPTLTIGPWQVLSRVPDRCGDQHLVSSRRAEPGQAVPVPQAGRGELVLLRLEGAGVEGLERLRALLWRARPRFAVVNGGRFSYRLVPGTAGDGLIVSRDRSLSRRGELVELPQVRNLRVDGADGPLRFDFYRVAIEPAPAQR